MFAPAAAGEMAEDTRRLTLSAMTNLMCRGRKRGLAGVVATQRLAKLAKNVAAEASNFLMVRTFLDIDMQRAADFLGMDRRQAERIRDLQRGQFLGLGPAISRRPGSVQVGVAQTGGKNAGQGLMPLPEASDDELEALLHGELAQEAQANAPRVAAPNRETVSDVEQAILHRASQSPPPRPVQAEEAPTPPIASDIAVVEQTETDSVDKLEEVSVERIVEDLAGQDGATFRSPGTLFCEFLTACRQHGVVSAHIDMGEFRQLFAFALSGTGRLSPPARATIERLAEGVEEDVLAPYLTIAVAALHGRNRPNEDELARVYGSSSPGRIRRLLEHLERSNLIAVHEDFGGTRTISVLGLEGVRAD
nr:ATP-binding protein [Qipengyuania citrea]